MPGSRLPRGWNLMKDKPTLYVVNGRISKYWPKVRDSGNPGQCSLRRPSIRPFWTGLHDYRRLLGALSAVRSSSLDYLRKNAQRNRIANPSPRSKIWSESCCSNPQFNPFSAYFLLDQSITSIWIELVVDNALRDTWNDLELTLVHGLPDQFEWLLFRGPLFGDKESMTGQYSRSNHAGIIRILQCGAIGEGSLDAASLRGRSLALLVH